MILSIFPCAGSMSWFYQYFHVQALCRGSINISICRLCSVVKSIHMRQKNFFFPASNGSPQDAAMLVRSLPTKSRTRLAHDVMYTSVTLAGRVYDVTDLLKMAALTAVFSSLSNVD